MLLPAALCQALPERLMERLTPLSARIVASLIETCKLNGVDPQYYRTDVITGIGNGRLQAHVGDLVRWAYGSGAGLKAVA